MFDLPEDMVVDTDQVSRLMQILDVFISIRRKPKQNVVSVIIKGIERNASKCTKLQTFENRWVMLSLLLFNMYPLFNIYIFTVLYNHFCVFSCFVDNFAI